MLPNSKYRLKGYKDTGSHMKMLIAVEQEVKSVGAKYCVFVQSCQWEIRNPQTHLLPQFVVIRI